MKSIHIIGGGMSGLMCAYLLTEFNLTAEIHIHESTNSLGGKCKGIEWNYLDHNHILMDNCPHIIFKAEFFSLLERANLLKNFYKIEDGFSFMLDGEGFSFNPPKNMGWILNHRYFKLGLTDYASIIKFCLSHKKRQMLSVEDVFSESKIYRLFWSPLCLAIMNNHPSQASASLFFNTFIYLLKHGRQALEIFKPIHSWTQDFIDPLSESLTEKGVKIHLNDGVKDISQFSTDENSTVILTTPLKQTLKLLDMDQDIPAEILPDYSPISSIHYVINDKNINVELTHIYNQNPSLEFWFQCRNGLISTIHSSLKNLNHNDIFELISSNFPREFSQPFMAVKSINYKNATIIHRPDTHKFIDYILKSPRKDNILIAGDWFMSNTLPASIETSYLSVLKILPYFK